MSFCPIVFPNVQFQMSSFVIRLNGVERDRGPGPIGGIKYMTFPKVAVSAQGFAGKPVLETDGTCLMCLMDYGRVNRHYGSSCFALIQLYLYLT